VLQSPQLGPGLQTELVDQGGPGAAVGLEGLGLPSRPVQRGHQQALQPFPHRVTRGQLSQFWCDRRGMTAGELGSVQPFQARHPALGESVGLGAQQRHVGDIAERVPAPEPEGLAQQPHRTDRPPGVGAVCAFGEQGLEAFGIEFVGVDAQRVAGALETDPRRITQRAAQPMYVQMQLLVRLVGGSALPQRIHQHIHRHRGVGPAQQNPQQGAGHRRGQRGRLPSVAHLQRPQDVELHTATPAVGQQHRIVVVAAAAPSGSGGGRPRVPRKAG